MLFINPILKAQYQAVYQKKELVKGRDTLPYRIMYPLNFSEEKIYPVVLFLHGASERGNDNNLQLKHGSTLFTNSNNRINFLAIVIFPQCSSDEYWFNAEIDIATEPITFKFQNGVIPTKALKLVNDIMDNLLLNHYVKKEQVFVMGLSMGGMGTFEILARKPNIFAAAIPICGGGNPMSARLYAKNTEL